MFVWVVSEKRKGCEGDGESVGVREGKRNR